MDKEELKLRTEELKRKEDELKLKTLFENFIKAKGAERQFLWEKYARAAVALERYCLVGNDTFVHILNMVPGSKAHKDLTEAFAKIKKGEHPKPPEMYARIHLGKSGIIGNEADLSADAEAAIHAAASELQSALKARKNEIRTKTGIKNIKDLQTTPAVNAASELLRTLCREHNVTLVKATNPGKMRIVSRSGLSQTNAPFRRRKSQPTPKRK